MTKPRRRTQAERSEEMRARLAQAAYEVIAERGHSAFRTAAVVAHAGVSQGALLHHFPNKEAVTLAAIEHGLNLDNEASLRRIADSGTDPAGILSMMADDFRTFFFGNRFWVALDITMDAAKDAAVSPAIREIAARARRPIYDQWASALAQCGWPPDRAERTVTMLAAFISGYAVRTLWTDNGLALDAALDRFLAFILSSSH